jgi:hypothetical protein
VGQHLENLVPGAAEDSVKLAVGNHAVENLEARGKQLGHTESHEHDAIAEQHLLISKVRHPVETLEHKADAQEHRK